MLFQATLSRFSNNFSIVFLCFLRIFILWHLPASHVLSNWLQKPAPTCLAALFNIVGRSVWNSPKKEASLELTSPSSSVVWLVCGGSTTTTSLFAHLFGNHRPSFKIDNQTRLEDSLFPIHQGFCLQPIVKKIMVKVIFEVSHFENGFVKSLLLWFLLGEISKGKKWDL